MNIQSVKMISVEEWDELVTKTYGRPYNFQQQDGCKARGIEEIDIPNPDPWDYENESIPEKVNGKKMGVSFKAWLERDPSQPLDSEDEWERSHGLNLFWSRNFYPSVEMVANDLYNRGLLPEGEYVIKIDW